MDSHQEEEKPGEVTEQKHFHFNWGLGHLGPLVNAGAAAFVCVLLWVTLSNFYSGHREAMVAAREEMREFRSALQMERDHDRAMREMTHEHINKLADQQQQTITVMEGQQKNIAATLETIKQMVTELRQTRNALEEAGKEKPKSPEQE